MRDKLSAAAFAMTAEYDRAISGYFAESESDSIFTTNKTISMRLKNELRYGENPHQQAGVYSIVEVQEPTLLMLGSSMEKICPTTTYWTWMRRYTSSDRLPSPRL